MLLCWVQLGPADTELQEMGDGREACASVPGPVCAARASVLNSGSCRKTSLVYSTNLSAPAIRTPQPDMKVAALGREDAQCVGPRLGLKG